MKRRALGPPFSFATIDRRRLRASLVLGRTLQTIWVDAPPIAAADLPSEVPDTTAGMVVYIDPVTGAILGQPAPGATPLPLSPEVSEALSTSSDGFVSVPVPGGGFMIDVQGRFQSPMMATIDANGVVRTQHLDELLFLNDPQ